MKKLVFYTFLFLSYSLTAQSTWEVKAKDIDPTNYYGITCANGVIGLVSSPNPMEVQDVVLNGVYDYYQRGRVSNILKTFNHVNMYLDVDGERVSRANMSNYEQTLDMKRAVLTTTFDKGDQVSVKHELMALRHLPYSALSVIEVTAKKDVVITPYSVIAAPTHLRDVRSFFNSVDRPHVEIPLLTSVADSPSGKHKLAASNSFIFPEKHGEEPHIIHEDWDYDRHWLKFTKKLKAGETYRFAVVGTTLSSLQYNDPHNEAERLTIYARLEGIDRLVQFHEAAWAKLWESDIIIAGDDESQRDVRSMLYHLYAFARAGTAYSLSPMGLSGLGYNGHIFWDTEIWMYPPLLALQPDIAASL
ncbi:MAG: glycoside hydrolase family 65 protein, partial [Bacteroidota bacterium]